MSRHARTALLASVGFLAVVLGPARADITSTFDTTGEAWSIVSFSDYSLNSFAVQGTYTPTYFATGGNPGGYIFATDPDAGDFTFSAPAKFLGNQSSATGLSYDMRYEDTVNFQTIDVILAGNNGKHLIWSNPSFVPNTTWQTNTASFTPSSSWHVAEGGALATAADFQGVLGSLAGLYIRGEYDQGGADDTSLDNVRLIVPNGAVPEPSSLALMAIALVPGARLIYRRSKSRRA
jgi:hypothetical protein